jgi:hypothetical protein
MRERYLYVPFIKLSLEPLVKLPGYAPLLDRFGFGAGLNDKGGLCEFIQSEYLDGLKNIRSEIRIVPYLLIH